MMGLRFWIFFGGLLAWGLPVAAREPGHPEPTAARVIEIDLHLARINSDEDRPAAMLLWLPEEALGKCENQKISSCGSKLWPGWNPAFDHVENHVSKARSRRVEDHFADPDNPPAPIAVVPWKMLPRHWNYKTGYQRVIEKGRSGVDPELTKKIREWARRKGADWKKAATVEFPIRRGKTLRCKVLDVLWGGNYRPYHTFYLLRIAGEQK